jgi:hypothetical protein
MPTLWQRNSWLGKLDCPFLSSSRTKLAVGSGAMFYLDDRERCSRIAEFKEEEKRFVAGTLPAAYYFITLVA